MKTRARSLLPRFAAWIMYCSSPNPTSKLFWKNCAPMSTPKAPTTLQTPCRSAPSRCGSASAWPSLVTRRITPRENSWSPFARRRMPEPRFLVVRLGSLGDIVHTFPAVAGLRESFPRSEIVWLTHPRGVECVSRSGLATEIILVDVRKLPSLKDAIGRVRKAKWHGAIDYQGLWKSALLPFLGGVSRRIGFSGETIREFGVPALYTERVKSKAAHIAEQNGELTLRAGAAKAVAPFELRVLPEEERRGRGGKEGEGLRGNV